MQLIVLIVSNATNEPEVDLRDQYADRCKGKPELMAICPDPEFKRCESCGEFECPAIEMTFQLWQQGLIQDDEDLRAMDDHFRREFVELLTEGNDIFGKNKPLMDKLLARKPDGRFELSTVETSFQCWLERQPDVA